MTAALTAAAESPWDNAEHAPNGPSGPAADLTPALMDDEYWTSLPDPIPVRALAAAFKVHDDTVLRRLKDGTIPGHYIGGSWIVFKSEVRAWLLTQRNTPLELDVDDDPLSELPDELGMAELVELFGKTKQTIRSWLRAGTIPGYFLAGRWIAYKHEIRQLLDATSNQPKS